MSILVIVTTTGQTSLNKYLDWPEVTLMVILYGIASLNLYTNWLVAFNQKSLRKLKVHGYKQSTIEATRQKGTLKPNTLLQHVNYVKITRNTCLYPLL